MTHYSKGMIVKIQKLEEQRVEKEDLGSPVADDNVG